MLQLSPPYQQPAAWQAWWHVFADNQTLGMHQMAKLRPASLSLWTLHCLLSCVHQHTAAMPGLCWRRVHVLQVDSLGQSNQLLNHASSNAEATTSAGSMEAASSVLIVSTSHGRCWCWDEEWSEQPAAELGAATYFHTPALVHACSGHRQVARPGASVSCRVDWPEPMRASQWRADIAAGMLWQSTACL